MARVRRKDFPDFDNTAEDLELFMKGLPSYVANTALNFYKDSFERQGYIDKTYNKWKPRKASKRRDSRPGRAILIDTGRLRRSLDFRLNRTSRGFEITFISDVPYAKVHNEGINKSIAVRAHSRKIYGKTTQVKSHKRNMRIDQRMFMGRSAFLENRIEMHLERALDQIFS